MNQPIYQRFVREVRSFTEVCRTAAGLLMPVACIGLMSRWGDCYAGSVLMFTKLGLASAAAAWVSKFLAVLGLIFLAFFTVRAILWFVFSPTPRDMRRTAQWFPPKNCPPIFGLPLGGGL